MVPEEWKQDYLRLYGQRNIFRPSKWVDLGEGMTREIGKQLFNTMVGLRQSWELKVEGNSDGQSVRKFLDGSADKGRTAYWQNTE